MTEPLIALEALTILDIVAMERKDGGYMVVGQPPGWFQRIFPGGDVSGSPYLTEFLEQSGAAAERTYSGVWTERDIDGHERGLEAWTAPMSGRPGLLIHLLGDEFELRQAALQQARDTSLSFERLGKVTRGLADTKLQLEMRNREVERINELKNEFLASMSHELRTPLNAIIGFSSLLAEESAGKLNTEQQTYVSHVGRAAHHLLDLINDILDLSKIEAGRLELAREMFPLDDALNEVLSTIRPLARDKNIRLVTGRGAGCQIFADRLRFKQILYNLLSNAIKFTPEGGEVRVEATVGREQLSVAVTDTGIGIPREELDAIFQKFHQAGKGGKGMREGTGLGLAITKRLVQQHGGEIRAYSEPGLGSRFVFTLPHSVGSPVAPTPDARPAAAQPPEAATSQPNTLIAVVEDNAANRALFEAMLKPSYQVAVYGNGADALEAFRRQAPDLVLLDIALPGMDGVEVLRRLRDEIPLRIPVIAVSAHAMSGDREKFLAAGFDQYIAKPIADRGVLLQAIEPLLRDGPRRGREKSAG